MDSKERRNKQSSSSEIRGNVLSVQSHTVFGYVGNKASVFPLQLLGFDVSFINSVQFSNHTGYAHGVSGQVLTGDQLNDLKEGLIKNNLHSNMDFLLTGYIGSKCFLEEIVDLSLLLKSEKEKRKQKFCHFCDPVLGDQGKLYVPEELIDVYIEKVLPIVSVLTPNHFEVEKLTKRKIYNVNQMKSALIQLHNLGIETIFVTSVDFHPKDLHKLYASTRCVSGDDERGYKLIEVAFPRLEGYFTGTGDLIAALLLAWTKILPDKSDMETVLKKCIATMQSVLRRTHDSFENGSNPQRELKLIESRFDILEPPEDEVDIEIRSEIYHG